MSAKRQTITFRPAADVLSLLQKAEVRKVGKRGSARGIRSKLINQALREAFSSLAGKRELCQVQVLAPGIQGKKI